MLLDKIKEQRVCFYGLGRENLSLIKYCQSKLSVLEIHFYDDVVTEYQDFVRVQKEDLIGFDLVFIAPGISIYSDFINQLVQSNIEILSPNQLFFELNKSQKICITGSKGKSTTANVLAELLTQHGISTKLAGNIGVPLCDAMDDTSNVTVVELSSYQLATLKLKDHFALITELFPEHLTWHLSEKNYFQDKLKIINQAKSVFVGRDFAQLVDLTSQVKLKDILSELTLEVKGTYFEAKHLRNNLNLALTVIDSVFGQDFIKSEVVHDVIQGFQSLPYRFEVIYNQNGLKIINDSISTTPESAIAALESTKDHKQILIIGGYDRGLSQIKLTQYLNTHSVELVCLLPDTGHQMLSVLDNCNYKKCEDLADAVKESFLNIKKLSNTVILFSPAAASYNNYKNFEERGHHFNQLIKDYI